MAPPTSYVYFKAVKTAENWSYTSFVVELDSTGQIIDMLNNP